MEQLEFLYAMQNEAEDKYHEADIILMDKMDAWINNTNLVKDARLKDEVEKARIASHAAWRRWETVTEIIAVCKAKGIM